MARRIIAAAALCAVAAAAPAGAHEGNPDYESLVRGVSPALTGFRVDVLNGDDRLQVVNRGPSAVTIEGYNREPYLRLWPDGRVEVNLRSPAHYLNGERYAGARVPDVADPKARPRWRVVARTGRYEFHDHRMHWMARADPDQVTDRSRRTKVFDWRVPVRASGRSGAIAGTLYWRGSSGGAPTGAYVAFGALVLLGAAAVVLVRRRRRSGGGADDPPAEAW